MARCERLPRLGKQIRLRDLLGHEHARRTIGVELAELERARFLVQKDVDAGNRNLRPEGIGHAGETLDARIELERGAKALVLYEAKRHLVHDAPHGLSDPRKIAQVAAREHLGNKAPLHGAAVIERIGSEQVGIARLVRRGITFEFAGDIDVFGLERAAVQGRQMVA